jgi:hypothetical protein
MAELVRCDICLKNVETMKCTECTFNSCIECMTTWYSTRHNRQKCPQCKRTETFDIEVEDHSDDYENSEEEEYDDIPDLIVANAVYIPNTIIISDFSNLGLDVIEQIVEDGRMFPSENFVHNFNNWPDNIRTQWGYNPVTMNIDDNEETIAYSIYHR